MRLSWLSLADCQRFQKTALSHRNPASNVRLMPGEILLLDRVRELPSKGSSNSGG